LFFKVTRAQQQRRPDTAAPCWPLLLDALCAQLPYGRLLLEVSNNILVRGIIENKRGNAPSGIGIFAALELARALSLGIFRRFHVEMILNVTVSLDFHAWLFLSDG
jgi:hypothetical protein